MRIIKGLMVTASERFLGPTGQPKSLKGSPQEGSFPSYWINAEFNPRAQVNPACSLPPGLGGLFKP